MQISITRDHKDVSDKSTPLVKVFKYESSRTILNALGLI